MKALVTGAGSGIGRACAIELARRGCDVIIQTGSNMQGLEKTAAEIRKLGRKCWMFLMDFSDIKNVHNFTAGVIDHVGYPDIIVNNAGVCKPAQIQDISDDDWDYVMNVNLRSVFAICHDLVPHMIEEKKGSIVNIASIWGRTGSAMESSYCASKAGLVMFSKSLAAELGPSGIRVNCVSPGCVDTKMNAGYSKEERADLEGRTPLGRFAKSSDIAQAVAFLALDESSFITGSDLLIDGGFTI